MGQCSAGVGGRSKRSPTCQSTKKRLGRCAPAAPHLERKDYKLASSLLPELWVSAAFALLGLGESQARFRVSAGAGAAVTLDWTHQRDINGHLRTVEGWEAVGNDLQASGISDGQPQV